MGKFSKAAADAALPIGRPCMVGTFMESLSAADRADLLAVWDDPMIPDAATSRAIATVSGVKIAPETLRRHFRGDCKCDRA